MSVVSEIREQLEAIDPPVFNYVAGAAEFASLTGEPLSTPAAYVMTEGEASAENQRMTGSILQRTEADIAVVIVTRNVSDGTGGAASDDIEVLKQSVRDALVGFEPDNAEPIEHIEGNLLKAKNGAVWWRDLFGTAYFTQEKA
jgi:hypothetical protein